MPDESGSSIVRKAALMESITQQAKAAPRPIMESTDLKCVLPIRDSIEPLRKEISPAAPHFVSSIHQEISMLARKQQGETSVAADADEKMRNTEFNGTIGAKPETENLRQHASQ